MDLELSEQGAAGFYRSAEVVADYMGEASKLVEGVMPRAATSHRDQSLNGLWYRAWAWIQSLRALNSTKHVQAHLTANRALLEITTDMVLLHCDQTNGLGWKYMQWGYSERMKAAEQIVSFFDGQAIPDEYSPMKNFYDQEKTIIDSTRRTLWPIKDKPDKAYHPGRWTGSSDLFSDVKEADRVFGDKIKAELDVSLTEYYRTEYRKMNWLIHSGGPGWWNMPPAALTLMSALAFKWSGDFGMFCTQLILIDSGFDKAIDNLRESWKELQGNRARAYYNLELIKRDAPIE
jgi:hypothetical protein